MDHHIRLFHEDVVESKKQILSSQINIIHMMKHIKNYKLIRKREISMNDKIKANITMLKSKINLVRYNFPRETIPNILEPKIEKVKQKIKKEEMDDFQKELEDIKNKLEKLNPKK
ncbi:MAG: hypothetical protein Q8N99_06615 [Nanoarchaeota archaeon]|nr:hypothetical protein [Nanoarchaeota archaeon]